MNTYVIITRTTPALALTLSLLGGVFPLKSLADQFDSNPGFDLFNTPNAELRIDLGGGLQDIDLRGSPVGPGDTDTIMQRLDPSPSGGVGEIQIELVELNLRSVNSVDVGGELFDLFVTLNPSGSSSGNIDIIANDVFHFYDSTLDVNFNVNLEPLNGGSPQQFQQQDTIRTFVNDPFIANFDNTPPPGYPVDPGLPSGDFFPATFGGGIPDFVTYNGSFFNTTMVPATDTGAPLNPPPVAVSQGPYVFSHDNLDVLLSGTPSFDPDGDSIIHSWLGPIFSAIGPITTMPFSQSALLTTTDISNVTLTVLDPELLTGQDEQSVLFQNAPPKIDYVVAKYGYHLFPEVLAHEPLAILYGVAQDPDTEVNCINACDFEQHTLDVDTEIFLGMNFDVENQAIVGTVPPDSRIDLIDLATTATHIAPGLNVVTVRDRAGASDGIAFELAERRGGQKSEALFIQTDSPSSISQTVDSPLSPFNFSFDYVFETLTGDLSVFLDNIELYRTMAADFGGVIDTVFIPIEDALLGLTDVELKFELNGPTGSRVLLDNIIWPGLVNGDFEGGVIVGWEPQSSSGSGVGIATFTFPELVAVSEPPLILLFAVGLFGMVARRRRHWVA